MAVIKEAKLHVGERIVDADRVDWYRSTFKNIKWVLDAGLPLIGTSFWSCIDNLEVGDPLYMCGTRLLKYVSLVVVWVHYQVRARRHQTWI